jgi:nitrogen fixation protein NifU and related proteins
MDIYAENILEHHRHPLHKQPLPGATVEHAEANLSCGDELTVRLKIDGDRIAAVGWDGTGCAISQAGMSILSEDLIGRTSAGIDALKKSDMYTLLGVPIGPRRFKCALLCLHTLKNAVRKAKGLPKQDWLQTVELTEN